MRLVDADKIVNGIALYMAENAYLNDTPLDALKMVANWIADAPTVDAVEVVQCNDCIYYHGKIGYGLGQCSKCRLMPYPEDFCSYGERKYGDGNG